MHFEPFPDAPDSDLGKRFPGPLSDWRTLARD